MQNMKIGPGTIVLNQSLDFPDVGEVISAPQGRSETSGMVWVQWSNTSVGIGGMAQELLQDLTLTAKVVFVFETPA